MRVEIPANFLRLLMKITMEIECTPEEARELVGLPDNEKVQEVMKSMVKESTKNMVNPFDPLGLSKVFFNGLPKG